MGLEKNQDEGVRVVVGMECCLYENVICIYRSVGSSITGYRRIAEDRCSWRGPRGIGIGNRIRPRGLACQSNTLLEGGLVTKEGQVHQADRMCKKSLLCRVTR